MLDRKVLIDASECFDVLGRFINGVDALITVPNCKSIKKQSEYGQYHLAFYATELIQSGEELRYNNRTIKAPWRMKKYRKEREVADFSEEQELDLSGLKKIPEPSNEVINETTEENHEPSNEVIIETTEQNQEPPNKAIIETTEENQEPSNKVIIETTEENQEPSNVVIIETTE